MTEASRYLLIEILGVITDPKYDYFRVAYPDIDLLDKGVLSDQYYNIILFAINSHYPQLGEYLINNTSNRTDPNYFNMAVDCGEFRIAQLLLRKGSININVNASRPQIPPDLEYNALERAVQNDDINMVQFLLTNPGTTITGDGIVLSSIDDDFLIYFSPDCKFSKVSTPRSKRRYYIELSLNIPK